MVKNRESFTGLPGVNELTRWQLIAMIQFNEHGNEDDDLGEATTEDLRATVQHYLDDSTVEDWRFLLRGAHVTVSA
jgi:hypothetical protein